MLLTSSALQTTKFKCVLSGKPPQATFLPVSTSHRAESRWSLHCDRAHARATPWLKCPPGSFHSVVTRSESVSVEQAHHSEIIFNFLFYGNNKIKYMLRSRKGSVATNRGLRFLPERPPVLLLCRKDVSCYEMKFCDKSPGPPFRPDWCPEPRPWEMSNRFSL